MRSLRPNLVKRIERLPKPTNVTGALQPLFEAISNAIHSTQAKFGSLVAEKGLVHVVVSTQRDKDDVWASVEDNGVGLDEKNWEAFTTTDTDHKMLSGGKGVGRLLWLDCFEKISIESVFSNEKKLMRRKFDFRLSLEEQIQNEKLFEEQSAKETMFLVRFTGLRENAYKQKFPGRGQYIFNHITSHFLPIFIGNRSPRVTVLIGDEIRTYPDAMNEVIYRRAPIITIKTKDYGDFLLTLMECNQIASRDLKGLHFVHFIAHDRTVHSQSIDGKLGLGRFGEGSDRVFHGVLTGKFLDDNVNQERTAFNFQEAVINALISDFCIQHVEQFLEEPLAHLRSSQRRAIEEITATYPSVAFGNSEELQKKVPSGELNKDAIYGHLSRERFRRDERQAEKIRRVLSRLKTPGADAASYLQAISEASQAIEEVERGSLAEYVVRRKVVLDFISLLLEKTRINPQDSAYQREDVLHSFICPMRVNQVSGGDGRRIVPAASHDLWIVDERLAFAEYFSSDTDFNSLASAFESEDRPDVLIFDHVHGLRQSDDSSKVLLIEFKRPGRTSYEDDENPQFQVQKYVRRLQSGALKDVRGRPIQLNERTVFYCFVVADIVGKLMDWTFDWQKTVDGRGRIYYPRDGYHGSIEVIGWDALIDDARSRNAAFFERAGISGRSFFSID